MSAGRDPASRAAETAPDPFQSGQDAFEQQLLLVRDVVEIVGLLTFHADAISSIDVLWYRGR